LIHRERRDALMLARIGNADMLPVSRTKLGIEIEPSVLHRSESDKNNAAASKGPHIERVARASPIFTSEHA
jgi:hypothetical protein